MPERKGVPNIADEHLRRRDAKAKRFRLRFIICNIPEVSLTAKQGPVPPKRAGAHAPPNPSISSRRVGAHKVMPANHFNSLDALSRHFFSFFPSVSEGSF
jgi:hypothetical protein